MTADQDADLKAAFSGGKTEDQSESGEVPERIKQHAPTPVLRPDGSWKARADAIDEKVRERQEAKKSKNEWAARLKTSQRRSKSKGYRRSKT